MTDNVKILKKEYSSPVTGSNSTLDPQLLGHLYSFFRTFVIIGRTAIQNVVIISRARKKFAKRSISALQLLGLIEHQVQVGHLIQFCDLLDSDTMAIMAI